MGNKFVIEYFKGILEFEGVFGQRERNVLTELEAKRAIAEKLEEIIEHLCESNLLAEFGWRRSNPRYFCESMGIAYAAIWSDESLERAWAYDSMSDSVYQRRGRRKRDSPLFKEYRLTVHQVSLRRGGVLCGLEVEEFDQYFDGRRIRVRHFELIDRFPENVRKMLVDPENFSDTFDPDKYPLSPVLILFDAVLDQVVSEREKKKR